MIFKLMILIFLVPSVGLTQIFHSANFNNKNFFSSNECGVNRFSVLDYDGEFIDAFGGKGRDRFQMMAAIWSTNRAECVKEYGVVQYIRGCAYYLEKDVETGELTKSIRKGRESRGTFILFKHPVWEVDSVDLDPLYSSYEGEDSSGLNRFNWQRFAKKELTLRNNEESLMKDKSILFHNINYDFLMNSNQELKQLFITDIPSNSSYRPQIINGKKGVHLSSLEFRTCLYRTRDIPADGDPVASPLQCFDWSSKMNFDFDKENFVKTEKIDPFCLE